MCTCCATYRARRETSAARRRPGIRASVSAFTQLVEGIQAGTDWELVGQADAVRALLDGVFEERIHLGDRARYQIRVNLQKKPDVASYAGFIVEEGNPTSGPFQGTTFVWFPGEGGSVVALGIGTDGFGADAAILGRPGHGRRLRALSRLHGGRLWVKPDLLDNATEVPDSVSSRWPEIDAALKAYARVLYATAAVTPSDVDAASVVRDLLDLFFYEHRSRYKGATQVAWETRLQDIHSYIFPVTDAAAVTDVLLERRFVILEGPPGTGKTRLARQAGEAVRPPRTRPRGPNSRPPPARTPERRRCCAHGSDRRSPPDSPGAHRA